MTILCDHTHYTKNTACRTWLISPSRKSETAGPIGERVQKILQQENVYVCVSWFSFNFKRIFVLLQLNRIFVLLQLQPYLCPSSTATSTKNATSTSTLNIVNIKLIVTHHASHINSKCNNFKRRAGIGVTVFGQNIYTSDRARSRSSSTAHPIPAVARCCAGSASMLSDPLQERCSRC